eukprot:GDKK01012781.1.p1 GENE.GDKK01012781.1~~GDKK01012781.1.p1  ORF type:complete len:553 (-),score=144.41 GDKK01012781.1:20-1678(-)
MELLANFPRLDSCSSNYRAIVIISCFIPKYTPPPATPAASSNPVVGSFSCLIQTRMQNDQMTHRLHGTVPNPSVLSLLLLAINEALIFLEAKNADCVIFNLPCDSLCGLMASTMLKRPYPSASPAPDTKKMPAEILSLFKHQMSSLDEERVALLWSSVHNMLTRPNFFFLPLPVSPNHSIVQQRAYSLALQAFHTSSSLKPFNFNTSLVTTIFNPDSQLSNLSHSTAKLFEGVTSEHLFEVKTDHHYTFHELPLHMAIPLPSNLLPSPFVPSPIHFSPTVVAWPAKIKPQSSLGADNLVVPSRTFAKGTGIEILLDTAFSKNKAVVLANIFTLPNASLPPLSSQCFPLADPVLAARYGQLNVFEWNKILTLPSPSAGGCTTAEETTPTALILEAISSIMQMIATWNAKEIVIGLRDVKTFLSLVGDGALLFIDERANGVRASALRRRTLEQNFLKSEVKCINEFFSTIKKWTPETEEGMVIKVKYFDPARLDTGAAIVSQLLSKKAADMLESVDTNTVRTSKIWTSVRSHANLSVVLGLQNSKPLVKQEPIQ